MKENKPHYNFKFNSNTKNLIYKEISETIISDIEKGVLNENFHLPSINEFSVKYAVARDTIEKAYKELKKQGYITSLRGKGYFVIGKKNKKIKVLLVFNKLSSFKKIIYDSLLKGLGKKAKVDLHIHHYDPAILKEILHSNLGKYNYYVIMPHFFYHAKKKHYIPLLKSIPSNELILLDKMVSGVYPDVSAIYQDFKYDIYDALNSTKNPIEKYRKIKMIFPDTAHHPLEITEGVQKFCDESGLSFIINTNIDKEVITKGTLYIVIEDTDLAKLIKKIRLTKLELGKEIGIISFNETDLKELLNITVISTDFSKMGSSLAAMILKKHHVQIKNPFSIIQRSSL